MWIWMSYLRKEKEAEKGWKAKEFEKQGRQIPQGIWLFGKFFFLWKAP